MIRRQDVLENKYLFILLERVMNSKTLCLRKRIDIILSQVSKLERGSPRSSLKNYLPIMAFWDKVRSMWYPLSQPIRFKMNQVTKFIQHTESPISYTHEWGHIPTLNKRTHLCSTDVVGTPTSPWCWRQCRAVARVTRPNLNHLILCWTNLFVHIFWFISKCFI